MNQNIIFSKTKASLDTLKSHSLRIGSRLKFTYMLVDGQTTVGRLRKKTQVLSDLESYLEWLAMQGYIRVNSNDWDDIAFQNSGKELPDFIRSTDDPLKTIRSMLIDYTIMVLGKHAHKPVQIIRDAEPTFSGLYQATEKSVKTARLLIDEEDSEILKNKYNGILNIYQY